MRKMMTASVKLSLAATIGFGLVWGTATTGFAQSDTLTVGAPPSLRPALTSLLPLFEREYGASVKVEYSPSRTLAQQVEQGAPIDVFLGAGVEEINALYKKGLTLSGKPQVYAQTSLVLVMSTDPQASLVSFREALPKQTTRIAIGNPRTSSLGDVTARALTKHPLTSQERSHIVQGQHSEDIMNMIHTGQVDVGLVYRVDAINGGQLRISDENPFDMDVPVQFGHAVVSTCRDNVRSVAKEFSSFLMSPRIQKLLLTYGFEQVSSNG